MTEGQRKFDAVQGFTQRVDVENGKPLGNGYLEPAPLPGITPRTYVVADAPEGFDSDSESYDPMIEVLSAFNAIPEEYHAELFHDFATAAASRNLRSLLDTISDWCATAELYANEALAHEVRTARGDRKGAVDWLIGR